MTQSNWVNPNGLPADEQITSARDMAILARALLREFPEYEMYWHIPAIKFGKRVMRNYNELIGRYPGADGMKTGFICASGFNVVATATRDGKQADRRGARRAVVAASRAPKAAQLFESGFNSRRPVLADALARHRRRAAADRRRAARTCATRCAAGIASAPPPRRPTTRANRRASCFEPAAGRQQSLDPA